MLSKRLNAILEMVPKTNRLIDVGCDHALLGIAALKSGLVNRVLGLDINVKTLIGAKNNIAKHQTKNIILMQNDGLDNIKINKSDVVVISGLGTRTIIKIIKKAEPINHLIIQSNNDISKLRLMMLFCGYYIIEEKVVKEKNIYYVIMSFSKKRKIYMPTDLIIGPYIKKQDMEYIQYLINKWIKISKSIPKLYFIKKSGYLLNIYFAKKASKKYFINQ